VGWYIVDAWSGTERLRANRLAPSIGEAERGCRYGLKSSLNFQSHLPAALTRNPNSRITLCSTDVYSSFVFHIHLPTALDVQTSSWTVRHVIFA